MASIELVGSNKTQQDPRPLLGHSEGPKELGSIPKRFLVGLGYTESDIIQDEKKKKS